MRRTGGGGSEDGGDGDGDGDNGGVEGRPNPTSASLN